MIVTEATGGAVTKCLELFKVTWGLPRDPYRTTPLTTLLDESISYRFFTDFILYPLERKWPPTLALQFSGRQQSQHIRSLKALRRACELLSTSGWVAPSNAPAAIVASKQQPMQPRRGSKRAAHPPGTVVVAVDKRASLLLEAVGSADGPLEVIDNDGAWHDVRVTMTRKDDNDATEAFCLYGGSAGKWLPPSFLRRRSQLLAASPLVLPSAGQRVVAFLCDTNGHEKWYPAAVTKVRRKTVSVQSAHGVQELGADQICTRVNVVMDLQEKDVRVGWCRDMVWPSYGTFRTSVAAEVTGPEQRFVVLTGPRPSSDVRWTLPYSLAAVEVESLRDSEHLSKWGVEEVNVMTARELCVQLNSLHCSLPDSEVDSYLESLPCFAGDDCSNDTEFNQTEAQARRCAGSGVKTSSAGLITAVPDRSRENDDDDDDAGGEEDEENDLYPVSFAAPGAQMTTDEACAVRARCMVFFDEGWFPGEVISSRAVTEDDDGVVVAEEGNDAAAGGGAARRYVLMV